jgi:hypothetical protein
MEFVAILYISGLKCLIRDETYIGRKATLTILCSETLTILCHKGIFLMSYDKSETTLGM